MSEVALGDISSRNLFVFGLGYTAQALACQRKNGWQMRGTCRTLEKQRMLADKLGLEAYIFDSDAPLRNSGLEALHQATHVLSCVPPNSHLNVDPVLELHAADIRLASKLCWIGYVSSTGVYGDHKGAWVDENSQTNPADPKAIARLDAEKGWLKLASSSTSVQIFRLGGIYGPGRSILDAMKSEKSALSKRQLARDERRFISRIHVDDVCQALIASIQSPCPGRVYNVVDDDPASRSEVVAFARHMIGENAAAAAAAAREKQQHISNVAEKRVINRRLKEELGVKLVYPSYVQGLTSIYERSLTL